MKYEKKIFNSVNDLIKFLNERPNYELISFIRDTMNADDIVCVCKIHPTTPYR